jgi:aqualysin 1
MPRLALALAVLLVVAAFPSLAAAAPPPRDQYIVVLDGGTDSTQVARQHAGRHGAEVKHVYGSALSGYAARIPEGRLAALRADRRVAYVERDAEVRKSVTQFGVTWGLDRIDQTSLPLSTTYTYSTDGSGVRAYIIDTGIRGTHKDFSGRVQPGTTAIDDGRGTNDCDGHGTHVAGTVGGTTYGVAKNVSLVPVRVLNCRGSGTTSGVIAGVNWVADDARGRPAVANMSLGGGASTALDEAVNTSISKGITYTLAAGNEGADACTKSPARVEAGITIAASTNTDAKPSWSNFGRCVDLFAPGANITSAYHSSDTATYTMSGTSMAAPHAAGAAAGYLQTNPAATPEGVGSHLQGTAKGSVSAANSPNDKILYVDGGTESSPPSTGGGDSTVTDPAPTSPKGKGNGNGKKSLGG